MKKTFIIKKHDDLEAFIDEITFITYEKPHEIIVREHKETLSEKQRKLYWRWIGIIATERGTSKEYVHFHYKKKILVHIYENDPERKEYADMIEAVRNVHRAGMKKDAKLLHDQIVELTSITDANTSQFAEYLTEIEKTAFDEDGIILPRPADRDYEALGVKIGETPQETKD